MWGGNFWTISRFCVNTNGRMAWFILMTSYHGTLGLSGALTFFIFWLNPPLTHYQAICILGGCGWKNTKTWDSVYVHSWHEEIEWEAVVKENKYLRWFQCTQLRWRHWVCILQARKTEFFAFAFLFRRYLPIS